MNATILVDWTLFRTHPYVQDFVEARVGQARMVLLVTDPTEDDFEFPDESTHLPLTTQTDIVHPRPQIDWDVVIRNSGGADVVAFKATALSVIQDVSKLEPVIALDANRAVNDMYREGGVLVTIEDF